MSRNKENNPLPSTTRANGSVFGLAKNPPSDEFFTDSLLDISRIPSPSPHKPVYGNPRRVIPTTRPLQNGRNTLNTGRRPVSSRADTSPATKKAKSLSPPKRPQSSSPLGRRDLITTPEQQQTPDHARSQSHFSSPPKALNDIFQRIADEEDLAATEGELGDDEDQEGYDEDDMSVVDTAPVTEEVRGPVQYQTSRETTPLNQQRQYPRNGDNNTEDVNITQASGMSFLGELTDQGVAAALTPHMIDHAKNRQRLDSYLRSKPLNFSPGPRPSERQDQYTGERRISPPKSSFKQDKTPNVAFRYAKPYANGIGKAFQEFQAKKSSPSGKIVVDSKSNSNKSASEIDYEDEDTPDELKDIEVILKRKRSNIPVRSQRTTPGRADNAKVRSKHGQANGQNPVKLEDVDLEDAGDLTRSTTSLSNDSGNQGAVNRNPVPATGKGLMNLWHRKAEEQRAQRVSREVASKESSEVDWAEAAADIPLPSVEESLTPQATPPKPRLPPSVQEAKSVERLKRWENDFTGMSFQVSDSPPVRSRPIVSDSSREKEIANLEKQAVTTNRLGEIWEKDPREAHFSTSRTPSIGRRHSNFLVHELQEEKSLEQENTEEVALQQEPETPAVVLKSSTNGEGRMYQETESSSSDRASSHDQLQRLARAMSSTPKSTPPPQSVMMPEARHEQDLAEQGDLTEASDLMDLDTKEILPQQQVPKESTVAATPKVIGAWTDTILPETVKTVKQQQSASRYAQTPHVSAGGWVITPLPSGIRQSSSSAPIPIIEETTEEIEQETIPPPCQDERQTEPLLPPPTEKEINIRPTPIPHSALTNILDQQKQRVMSEDITTARDDTLNLGDATIASLEDLITFDENDMSTLIRLGADQDDTIDRLADVGFQDQASAEAALLERLGIKLERLRTNIHVARKGLSKLEHQVSQPSLQPEFDATALEQTVKLEICSICGQNDVEHSHSTFSAFPLAYSTFTLPIPLLFRPRPRTSTAKTYKRNFPQSLISSSSLPQPTLLGWITISIWLWYILESIMCELYSHPLYADKYTWPSEPEPVFPYVLPTMLCRWLGISSDITQTVGTVAALPAALFFNPLSRILVAFWRVLGMSMGWTDGFVDDKYGEAAGEFVKSATQAGLRAAVSSAIAGEGVVSMMNDEFL